MNKFIHIKDIETVLAKMNVFEYFPDANLDLLVLSFLRRDTKVKDYEVNFLRLTELYGLTEDARDYQILEFYGDAVLGMITTDIIKFRFELTQRPASLSIGKGTIVSNATLTKISRELSICENIFGYSETHELKKHNICGDNIEAIIGAIYFQYGMKALLTIKEWLLSIPAFEHAIEKTLAKMAEVQAIQLKTVERENLATKFKRFTSKMSFRGTLDDFIGLYMDIYPQMEFITECEENMCDIYLNNEDIQLKYYLLSHNKDERYDYRWKEDLERILRLLKVWI